MLLQLCVQVDSSERVIGRSPGLERFLNTDASLYIGGFPSEFTPTSSKTLIVLYLHKHTGTVHVAIFLYISRSLTKSKIQMYIV